MPQRIHPNAGNKIQISFPFQVEEENTLSAMQYHGIPAIGLEQILPLQSSNAVKRRRRSLGQSFHDASIVKEASLCRADAFARREREPAFNARTGRQG